MIPIKSSQIDGAEYDNDKRDLHIKFKNGRIYTYRNVSKETYQGFILSVSKGKFLKDIEKKHVYSERKKETK